MSILVLNQSLSIAENPYKSTKSRVTARGRLVSRIAVIASVVILGAAGYAAVGTAEAGPTVAASYQEILVVPGETLWNIASQVGSGAKTREIVNEIMALNSLTNPEVKAGQRIFIPIK